MTRASSESRVRRLLSLAPVLVCYSVAIWHMRYDWTYDESYRHGWLVLPLALYLFAVRWRDRPPVAQGSGREPLWGWVIMALTFPLLWVVREANPEWRLLSIVFAGLAVAASLLYLTNTGGRRWAIHFAGPIVFFMASVPWPSLVERAVTSTLMPVNASLTLEALHWLNIPAVLRGNLIALAGGTLGIEEACSGIRSLQSTVMAAWFVGELHSLRWQRRLGLIGAGVVIAFLTNVLRTVFLSVIAARHGMAEVSSWHDTAGLSALAANGAAVLLTGSLLARGMSRGATFPAARAAPAAGTLRLPVRGPAICAAGLAAMLPLTEWWYGRRETVAGPVWHLREPSTARGFRALPIDDRTAITLRYSRAWSAKWVTRDGKPVHGYYCEWEAGRVPPENMNVHQPGGCLANLGMKLLEELAPLEVNAGGIVHQVRLMRFQDGSRPLYLIYSVTESSRSNHSSTSPFDFTYGNRWEYVFSGRRNPGQRFIEIGLWDEPSEEVVRTEFTAFLTEWIREGNL